MGAGEEGAVGLDGVVSGGFFCGLGVLFWCCGGWGWGFMCLVLEEMGWNGMGSWIRGEGGRKEKRD